MNALALFRVTAVSAALTAAAAALVACIGWFVFERFGAITTILMFTFLSLLLVLGFAGMVTGSLAVSQDTTHPVSLAVAAAVLQYLIIVAGSYAMALQDEIRFISLLVIPVAAIRAAHAIHRQRNRT